MEPQAIGAPLAEDASRNLARFVVSIPYASLPEDLLRAARDGLLDTIGVILAGSGTSSATGVRRMLSEWGGRPDCTLLGDPARLPAISAAFANAAAAHQYDFDDTHDAAVVHPTANSFPATLAVAETLPRCSGEDFLAAIAVANEVTCRLGMALTGDLFDYPFTRPPVLGTFGAAAAASRLLGLDEEQTRSAFGLTLHQTCNTLECLFAPGSEVRGLRDGFSVRNGVTAACMAREGIVGDSTAFEGRFGLFNAFFGGDYRREPLVEGLGTRYEAANVSIKPWPSARETHATIHATLDLRRSHELDSARIEEVVLSVGRPNLEFCEPGKAKRRPARRMDALSSLPFAVAVALVRGRVTLESYTNEAIRDEAVLEMAQRVRWELDPSIEEGTIEGGRVKIRLAGGRTFEAVARHAFGHPGSPLPEETRNEKLRDCIAVMPTPLGDEQTARIIGTVGRIERLTVADLTQALTFDGRT